MSSALIRKNFLGHFKSLKKHSRVRSSIILISYVAQILVSIIAGYFLLRVGSLTAYFGTGLISLFIATRFRGINNIVHECSHYTFTQNRPDNVVFGSISAALVLASFEAYRKEHMTHHANLGDYEKDLDFRNLQDFRLESELTWPTIARHIVTPLVGLHLPRYLGVDLSVRDGFGYALLKIVLIFGTIGFAYAYPVSALTLIIIPFVWIYPAINYWTDFVDHGGLLESEDDLETSRNLVVPTPLRLIMFPRNDCYHLIHHLFPSVPVQHFDRCHELMLENQAYRSANKGGDQSQSVEGIKRQRKGEE